MNDIHAKAAAALTVKPDEFRSAKYKSLRDQLDTVDTYCFRQGGRLHSRQIIALICMNWTNDQSKKDHSGTMIETASGYLNAAEQDEDVYLDDWQRGVAIDAIIAAIKDTETNSKND